MHLRSRVSRLASRALHHSSRVTQSSVLVPQSSPVGICNNGIEITSGYMAFRGVLWHEFVGVVQDCADRAWVGRRVVGEINAACRCCAVCARGDASHCPERTTLGIDRRDGAMAEL